MRGFGDAHESRKMICSWRPAAREAAPSSANQLPPKTAPRRSRPLALAAIARPPFRLSSGHRAILRKARASAPARSRTTLRRPPRTHRRRDAAIRARSESSRRGRARRAAARRLAVRCAAPRDAPSIRHRHRPATVERLPHRWHQARDRRERRGGLIGDRKIGYRRRRHRDHHALRLPTRPASASSSTYRSTVASKLNPLS